MRIYFSRHAKRQMKWREITEEEVNSVLESPDDLRESIKGRKKARKHVGEKEIEVVFKEETDRIVIVTAINKTG